MSDADYTLVMPFVACQSQGGAYEDNAYVSGWEMGRLDMQMAMGKVLPNYADIVTVHTGNLKQLDLLAMNHGYTTEIITTDSVPGWSTVKIYIPSEDCCYEND